MKERIENARITRVSIEDGDRGPTAWIHIEGDGWGCGFGGRKLGGTYTHHFIFGVLQVLEVEFWEDLPGTPVRARTQGMGGGIIAIGHFLKEKWFDAKALGEDDR